MSFIKSFGIGILYFLLSPVILAGCIIIGVVNIFNFLIQFVIMTINFFRGDKLFPPFKKDLDAIKILNGLGKKQALATAENTQQPAENKGPTFIQQNFYANPQGQFPNDPQLQASRTFQQFPQSQQPQQAFPQIGNNEQEPIETTMEDLSND